MPCARSENKLKQTASIFRLYDFPYVCQGVLTSNFFLYKSIYKRNCYIPWWKTLTRHFLSNRRGSFAYEDAQIMWKYWKSRIHIKKDKNHALLWSMNFLCQEPTLVTRKYLLADVKPIATLYSNFTFAFQYLFITFLYIG